MIVMVDVIFGDADDPRVTAEAAPTASRIRIDDVIIIWTGANHHDRAVAALRRLLAELDEGGAR